MSRYIYIAVLLKMTFGQSLEPGLSSCGRNITDSVGQLTIPAATNCSFRIIRPHAERIFLITRDTFYCCYEIIVRDGTSESGTVILNLTNTPEIEIHPTNSSKIFVTFLWLLYQFTEHGPFLIDYYTAGPPDNRGSRFDIADASRLFISTMKTSNVTFELLCTRSESMTLSLDRPLVLTVEQEPRIEQNIKVSGVIGLLADNDVLVYVEKQGYSPAAFMPTDVMGTKYYVISKGRGDIIIIGSFSTKVSLTFPECPGNCTLPDCATKNLTFYLYDCQRILHSCLSDLTGAKITSDLPVSVTVDDGTQLLPLPPVRAWGTHFVLIAVPRNLFATVKLRVISKDVLTNVNVRCFGMDNTVHKESDVFLEKDGDHSIKVINSSSNCWITSDKPILPIHLIIMEKETVSVIPPVQQYANEYLIPAELCTDIGFSKNTLVLVIQTKNVDGLRMDGFSISESDQIQQVGSSGFGIIYVNITEQKQRVIRHTTPNVVFGAFLLCLTDYASHIVPLGMRMAPIEEKCEKTPTVPGDGLDNDCDKKIDEDTCSPGDVNGLVSDCAAVVREIMPCLGYTDTNGIQWKTTTPNSYDHQSCPKTVSGVPTTLITQDYQQIPSQFRISTKNTRNARQEHTMASSLIQQGIFNAGTSKDIFKTDSDIFDSFVNSETGKDILNSSTDIFNTFTDDFNVLYKNFISLFNTWSLGVASNYCELKDGINGVWRGADTKWCVNERLSVIHLKLNLTLNGTYDGIIDDLLNETLEITTELIDTDDFSPASLQTVVDNLDLVTKITENRTTGVTIAETEKFISLVDNILSNKITNTWKTLNNKVNTTNHAPVIMDIVSRFGQQILRNESGQDVTLIRENIVLEAKRGNIDDVIFPNKTVLTEKYQQLSNISNSVNAILFLSRKTIKNNLAGSIDYTAAYYRTLNKLLPNTNSDNIGSDIVSFSLPKNVTADNLSPPVQIGYEHKYNNGTNSTCVFWDFDIGIGGEWSTEGCYAEYRNDSFTSCRCNHFTNFAVLMSTSTFSHEDTIALTILTWPGCLISIICLLLTIVVYIYFWRNVKSDKAKILVCLAVVLILAYIILLAGLDKTGNSSTCSAIALALHYLFLCALCLMVAEGLEVAITILRTFAPRKSNAALLLSFGLVSPLLIVIISVVATSFHGYGTDKYCWLSVSNGLIYAFLVPCIAAVQTNIIITVLVLKKMFTTKAMMKKETKDKIKAGVRSIAVLSPVLGLTWLFGILAFHHHLIVFSYLFTIFNSLQGLFIFIFHCLMNTKIQQAAKRQHERFTQSHPWARLKKKEKMDVTTISDTAASSKVTDNTAV